jgi:hypothetical protein
MTYPELILIKDGSVTLNTDGKTITLYYPANQLTVIVDKINFTDSRLKNVWKRNCLYRLRFIAKENKLNNQIKMRIR